jgi:6-phosphogluconolactonase
LLTRKTFADRDALRKAVLDSLTILIRESLSNQKIFHLALTGGEMGGEVAKHLAEEINHKPENYRGLHIWWSDERFVPHDSEERNAFPFLEALSPEVEVHIHQSIASDSNIDVETSARRYGADIYGVTMDLTLLSIGTDGHVASLFPHSWNSDETSGVIAIPQAPKNPPQRVSFSMLKINESARVWIIASGLAKAAIVQRLLSGDTSLPATFVKGREETLLFTDFSSE